MRGPADQLLIERDGLVRDAGPGEVLLHPLAAGISHAFAGGRILEERGEFRAQVAGELIGIHREAGYRVLFEGHQVAGLAIDDHFENAAGGAGDDRGSACHRFQVDDAEGLVDGGAAEDSGVGVELNGLGAGDHLLDPDDVRVVVARLIDLGAHLGGDLWRIRRPGTEDDLGLRRQIADGVDQVGDALLARDAAYEQHIRDSRIDAIFGERGGVGGLLVLVEVDAVVDDVDAVGWHVG